MEIRIWRSLLALLTLALLAATPARAEWRRAESPNFIVYSEESESRLRERVALLESFDRLLRTVTSVSAPPAPNKLHIYLVRGEDELRQIVAVPTGIGGFYRATPDGIAALVDAREQGRGNEILFHEYAHHFMWQYAPSPYPTWYVEGFAEYYATARFEGQRIDVGNFSPGRAQAIVAGNWLPIDRLLFAQPRSLDRESRASYYALSWLLVHYFYSTPERQEMLRRYLASPRTGDPAAALQAATGLTPQALLDELRRYIRGGRIRYHQLVRPQEVVPAVTITTLPRSADDLLPYEAALRIGIDRADEQAYLQRIRAAAARHPQDRFAMRVLAQAEARFGDPAAADRLLETLMAEAPQDAELMYFKGRRHLTAAENGEEWEQEARLARPWFARAHRIDPNHFQTLYRYAQSLRGDRNFGSENTSNILLLAHQLAPQVAEIRMNAARQLLARGQVDDAETLLRPLASDPHNSALAQAAQRLLQQARQRSAPGAETDDEADEETATDEQ